MSGGDGDDIDAWKRKRIRENIVFLLAQSFSYSLHSGQKMKDEDGDGDEWVPTRFELH